MNRKIKIITACIIFLLACSGLHSQTYHYYYGNIHSHSSYSDGNKDHLLSTPYEDFNYAKKSLHFDFLGISDHNHMLSIDDFHKGLGQADSANEDSSFVCLYGVEWGYYDGGHVLVYGFDSLLGWENGSYDIFVADTDYVGLFKKVAAKPGAFAFLAHPSSGEFEDLLNIPFNDTLDQAIIGMPLRNGPAFSEDTTYSDPSTSSYLSYFNKLLKKGYHPGINLDHDNHYTTFGRMAQSRMVVLAPALTREAILEAIRNRRFYASDDWNVQVDFTVNSQPMGSFVHGNNHPLISVAVNDPDPGDSVESIEIYTGVSGSGISPVLLVSNSTSSILTYTDTAAFGNKYYYAIIYQADGDMMVTSPIWLESDWSVKEVDKLNSNLLIFPNPATGTATVSYTLNEASEVSLEICNIAGVNKMIIPNKKQAPGIYNLQLNCRENNLQQGFYIAKLRTGNTVSYRKFIVL